MRRIWFISADKIESSSSACKQSSQIKLKLKLKLKLKSNSIVSQIIIKYNCQQIHTYKTTLYALGIPKQSQTDVFNSFEFNLETNSFH